MSMTIVAGYMGWAGSIYDTRQYLFGNCQDLSHKLAKHADAVVILNATFDIQAFHCVLGEFYTYMAILSNDAS